MHKIEEVFTLDDEDLEYLFNKYSKKLDVEMEEEIEKLRQEYSIIINK